MRVFSYKRPSTLLLLNAILTGVQSTACDKLVLEEFLQRPVQVCMRSMIKLLMIVSSKL